MRLDGFELLEAAGVALGGLVDLSRQLVINPH